jgi:hypothetical protein
LRPRRAFGDHLPRAGGPESGLHVVHSQDSGPVGNVEHSGQNQWAHEQPHGPLQSLPPTIAPRATTVMLGGLQKTGRSRAFACAAKKTAAAMPMSNESGRGRRMRSFLTPVLRQPKQPEAH